jgi:predicted nucleotidyltransferase component of viral defense system
LFNAPALTGKIAFRGGTAIHKLLFAKPLRYSEDIDLVQTRAEQIGATVDAIREALSWLGQCRREHAGHSMHLVFRFAPESQPDTSLKLKVEINTREHECVLGLKPFPFGVKNGWYQATTDITSFVPEETFATKLRALLQRRKSRDLFDLDRGLRELSMNTGALLACFDHYLELEGKPITRAMAEQRMLEKLTHSITEDIGPLLPTGIRFDEPDAIAAFENIWNSLIAKLTGDPWKQTDRAIQELRQRKYPQLFLE